MKSSCVDCPIGGKHRAACPFALRTSQRGEYLFLEGELADRLWFVRRGVVLLGRNRGERHEARAVRRAGSFVGLETIANIPYADSAYTATRSIVCAASQEALDPWLPEASEFVLKSVVRSQAADFPRYAASTLRRLARWLYDELPSDLPNQISRSEAAGVLCMSPETLSRGLAALQDMGAIAVHARRITLGDAKLLEKAASCDDEP